MEVMKAISKFVIENWLSKVAFEEMVINGLLKSYSIKAISAANIKLMGLVLNKLF